MTHSHTLSHSLTHIICDIWKMSSAELLEQVMCSGLLVGWVAGGPCRRYPFSTLDLSSGTLFLCLSGHLLSSLLSSQNIHCLAAVFLPLFIMKIMFSLLVCGHLCVLCCVCVHACGHLCVVCVCMHADTCVVCVCACMRTPVCCVCVCVRMCMLRMVLLDKTVSAL